MRGHQRKRARGGERGTTLIEVMIALGVLSVGALALVRLTVASAEGAGVSSRLTYATILARSKLDELVRLNPTDAALTDGTHDEPGGQNLGPTGRPYKPSGAPTGAFDSDDGWYARSWTVTDQTIDATSVAPDYKRIVVEVSWYDGSVKRRRQVTVVGGVSLQ